MFGRVLFFSSSSLYIFTARVRYAILSARVRYAILTVSNHSHFQCIPNLRKFCQKTDVHMNDTLKTTILTCSNQIQLAIVIHPPYPNNIHFFLH